MSEPDLPSLQSPYRITRTLARGPLSWRWLAVHDVALTSHVIHELIARHDKIERRRFLSAFEALADLHHPHLLPVESIAMGERGKTTLVTPFTGNQEGLITLGSLLKSKGGRMSASEVERAMVQLLDACRYAHSQRRHHGPIALEEVLVDRHGRLFIELYGVARAIRGLKPGNEELERDEVRSVVEMAYRLLTGLSADEPWIVPSRIVRRLDERWDAYFAEGLDPASGFASAMEAMDSLPSVRRLADAKVSTSPVRKVLGHIGAGLGLR